MRMCRLRLPFLELLLRAQKETNQVQGSPILKHLYGLSGENVQSTSPFIFGHLSYAASASPAAHKSLTPRAQSEKRTTSDCDAQWAKMGQVNQCGVLPL